MKKPFVIFVGGWGGSAKRMLKTYLSECHKSPGERDFIRDMMDIEQKELSEDNVYLFNTHDRFPPEHLDTNIKVVIPIAHPLNVVLYTCFRLSPRKQIPQLRLDVLTNKSIDQLYDEIILKESWKHFDAFRFEDHLDRWYKHHSYPVMFVKYDAMWTHTNKILEFCELPSECEKDFPEKRIRVVDWTSFEEKDLLQETYKGLIEKYEKMDDVTIFEAK